MGGAVRTCTDLADAKLVEKAVPSFTHANIRFESLSGKPELSLVDRVNVAPDPDRSGKDQRQEVAFGESGLRIVLPVTCGLVELKLMQFQEAPIKAQALDATGARLWRGGLDEAIKVPKVLQVAAQGIRAIELIGGGGQAVLYEICYEAAPGQGKDGGARIIDIDRGVPIASPDVLLGRSGGDEVAAVVGIVDDQPVDEWAGHVVERRQGRDGRTCVLVTYAPRDPQGGPWDGFRIEPPAGKTIALVSRAASISEPPTRARTT